MPPANENLRTLDEIVSGMVLQHGSNPIREPFILVLDLTQKYVAASATFHPLINLGITEEQVKGSLLASYGTTFYENGLSDSDWAAARNPTDLTKWRGPYLDNQFYSLNIDVPAETWKLTYKLVTTTQTIVHHILHGKLIRTGTIKQRLVGEPNPLGGGMIEFPVSQQGNTGVRLVDSDGNGLSEFSAAITYQGFSIGDPYVWPIMSKVPVKLPSIYGVYRLFEKENTFVNALVDEATSDHKARMNKYALSSKLKPMVDGYFYHKVFIHADGNEMTIDLYTKDVSTTENGKKFFEIKGEKSVKYTNYNIEWKDSTNTNVNLSVMFYNNPHIENGFKITTSKIDNTCGMLVNNYKPKLMKLPSLTTTNYNKLHTRLNNATKKFEIKSIKAKSEQWKLTNGKLL
tara:strand:+ start:439 stop:1644 length:1206 start_codon:yes stop_codon:yes gene_type:complete